MYHLYNIYNLYMQIEPHIKIAKFREGAGRNNFYSWFYFEFQLSVHFHNTFFGCFEIV